MNFRGRLEDLESQVFTQLLETVGKKGSPHEYFRGKSVKARLRPGQWIEIILVKQSLFVYDSAAHGLYELRMEYDLEDFISILEYLEED
jgi:LPS sulfotransferase NodH